MISADQWINLPVGYNLNDHVGVSIIPEPLVMFEHVLIVHIDRHSDYTPKYSLL
jgi:hypothetical protein